MIRRSLKDKEIARVLLSDITNMAVGDILPVYVCSPVQNGDYILGYNGSTLTHKEFDTCIESQEAEYVYREDKIPTMDSLVFNIRKFDDGLTFSREIKTLITEIPQIRVHRVVMLCNGYYLGVNGSSYITTNNESTAKTDERYWWDFIGSNANATNVGLYNPSSGRYAEYRGRGPVTAKESTFLTDFSGNKFCFGGKASGNTQMINISTSGTVGNVSGKMTETHNWELFSLDVSPTTQGAVTWMYPMPYTIDTYNLTSDSLLAGYKGEVFRFNQEGSYLRHGNNALVGLSASSTGTDLNAAWILYKIKQ